jgi:hypothetical protein
MPFDLANKADFYEIGILKTENTLFETTIH